MAAERQIRCFFLQKTADIFSYFSTRTYVVSTHQKCLGEVLLMSTHIMYFHGDIRNILS